jgi:flagellar motor switch protein FliN/FliY
LDRPAGEPLDIRVNGRLISRGEVVAINDRYGVRFTDVVGADGMVMEQLT